MLARRYLDKALDLVQRLQETQLGNIERAAEVIVQAIADGRTPYAWGGPHSSLPVQDIFWRAGGLALVNPVFTHGLSLEVGPIYLTSFLERVEGAGREFFSQIGADATYKQVMEAVQVGLSCAAHVFNGMIPLHHRKPGLVGAILTCEKIDAELIADGRHVSPVAMQILLRCKGTDGVHLITDNTRWAGMPNGTYEDGERTIVKEDDQAYVVGGTLVGSVAPMNLCVANMVRSVGCSLADAVKMASLNPAAVISADDRKGSLEPGKDADLVVIDEEVKVYMTMVRGEEVFRSEFWN